MTAHFPAFVTEICASIDANSLLAKFGITTTVALGAVALGVIGVFNIFGTISPECSEIGSKKNIF